ncbi:unnamed protein product [Orchesella dallaii]|uniref:Midasin n=1 Tax=Orchesella dallaii TaxID=48710 RepID=A0ABP1R2R1_9HEXA
MRRYTAQVIHCKADLENLENSLPAATAEHAQCKVVLKILEDTLVGSLGSMASLRGEAITTLELPGVASPGGGDRVNHDLYPDLEDHLRDGHFINSNNNINCGLCISARHFQQGIAEQQQQGEQRLENRGEQQQEQDDGELPGARKGKDMERLLQLQQQEATGEEEDLQPGEPGNHQDDDADAAGNKEADDDDDADAAGNKEADDVRPGEPGNHQDDDADAAGNKEADDVRPGEPVNHPDSDYDDDTDSTEEVNRVEIQFSPGAHEGWVDLIQVKLGYHK